MLQAVGRVLRVAGYPVRVAWRRPLRALTAVIVVMLATCVGLYCFAVQQWRSAQDALRNDRPDLAWDRLHLCQRVWFRSPEVHLLAARAARLVGDLDAAERHLNRCLEIQGGASERVQLEFLLLRVQTGEVDELAPVLVDTAQKGHPEAPLIMETLARAYIIRLRYKPAYSCLSYWIEIRPDDAKAYQWRGWVLEKLNNQKDATRDYHHALEVDPDLIPVRLRVAEMLLEDHQAPEALPHLERLYKQAPDDPQVQARMGMCRFLQGRAGEARRLMEAAVVHLPHDAALLVSLAKLDVQEGRGPEAERRLRKVLESDPSDTEALYVLTSALQLQSRTEESAAALADYEHKRALVERINTMLKDVADSPTAKPDDYAEIGRLFLQIGRDKFGVYWSERALEGDPANQAAHRALAAYYDRKGDTARAAGHRSKVRGSTTGPTPGGATPKH